MTGTEFQVLKSIGFVSAFAMVLILQRWRPHRALSGSWRTNASLWAVNIVAVGVVCTGCACTVALLAEDRGLGLFRQIDLSAGASIGASLLTLDFVAYLWHRANHALPFLWRFHQAHHSDPDFTATTALRFHPGELLLALPIRLVTVAALGIPVLGIIVFEIVFAFSTFLEHGNIGFTAKVERAAGHVFVTPSLHRWHHGVERYQLGSNFATVFSFWDRIFGSFSDNSPEIQVRTGLSQDRRSLGPVEVLKLPITDRFAMHQAGE